MASLMGFHSGENDSAQRSEAARTPSRRLAPAHFLSAGRTRRRELIDVALGEAPADRVIVGGKLVNVFTAEIYPADVAIKGDRIAFVGEVTHTIGPETEEIHAQGMYLTPGLIDQHTHTYESQLSVVHYAAAVLPRGTTTQCTDFYGEAVVAGVEGVRFSLDLARSTPLKILFVLPTPAFYQDGALGHTGTPTESDMLAMLEWPECVGVNDTFGSKIVGKDEFLLQLVEAAQARGKKICGHGSELSGKVLQAWMSFVRNTDDHEAVNAEEALERARLGLTVVMREGSGCPNVADLCPALVEHRIDSRRFAFDADLISPMQLIRDGHIDNNIRIAVRSGVDPIRAVQIATLNAAECLNVSGEIGSIGPGKIADILLVEDLPSFKVGTVIADGRIVARNGELAIDLPRPSYPDFVRNTVRIGAEIRPTDLVIPGPANRADVLARVIGARGDSLITEELHLRLPVRGGAIEDDPERDILKIVSIERHRGSGQIGKAFIQGFGLRSGAIAGTYNPHHQNLVVIGATDQDIAFAANEVARMGGGFIVVREGTVLARLELPLFGLLADEALPDVVGKIELLNEAVQSLGSSLPAPFHTLAFVGLPVIIGKLKISPKGLVDVWKEQILDIAAG